MWPHVTITPENMGFLVVGFVCGIILCLLVQRFWLNLFAGKIKSLSDEALRNNTGEFLDLAERFFDAHAREVRNDLGHAGEKIALKVDPVKEALARYEDRLGLMEREREKAFGSLTAQVKEMAGVQQRLEKETGNLTRALRLPHVRGRWGEMTLKRVAEMAGMVDCCDFFEQASTGSGKGALRPDMVVRLPGGRQIVVDAKVPLAAYLDALEAGDKKERRGLLDNHASQVLAHVHALSSKAYWKSFTPTPEFVVLFIPGETYFSAALSRKPDLLERAVEKGVILATPTTFIALLKAVAYGWRQEKSAENAREIMALGRELLERITAVASHFSRLGRDIDRCADSYNKTLGSLEKRVLVSARKLSDLGMGSGREDIPSMEPLENSTRKPALGEEEL